MIKLTGIEKLYLILRQDGILKQCRIGKCKECPLVRYFRPIMKAGKRGDWPCIELYDFFGGKKDEWKMSGLYEAMQQFYQEINQEINREINND